MFRLNQRVCRIMWDNGRPYLKVETVTKVTSRSYYVANAKKHSHGWHATFKVAIETEYLSLFRDWDTTYGDILRKRFYDADWTIHDTVRCICRVRRLERRLGRRFRKAHSQD